MAEQLDLLSGAEAIAAYLGWSVRSTFYACEKGHIPAFKIGVKWCARKSTLKAHIDDLESATRRKQTKSAESPRRSFDDASRARDGAIRAR